MGSGEGVPPGGVSDRERQLEEEVRRNRAQFEARKVQEARAARAAVVRKNITITVLLATLVLGTGWWLTHRKAPPDRNRADDYAKQVRTDVLRLMPKGKWIAKMPEGWRGPADPEAAMKTCRSILKAVCPLPDGFSSVEIQDDAGKLIVSCESSMLDFRDRF